MGDPKTPFSIATTPRFLPIPGLLHFTLDPYLIMLNVKQGGIKYHFLSLWYDSTWDWTLVFRAISEHTWLLSLLCEFFTLAFVDDFSQKSGWQQVSSGLQDSSQYSGRSQQCSSLDGLLMSSNFHIFQSLYQSFRDCSKHVNYNSYLCHLHVLYFFSSLARS